MPKSTVCSQTLSSDDVEAFTYAITRHYWYELFIDDLPIWGFVGDIKPSKAAAAGAGGEEEDTVVLYTHKQLDISYNGDRVSGRKTAIAMGVWVCGCVGASGSEQLSVNTVVCVRLAACCVISFNRFSQPK